MTRYNPRRERVSKETLTTIRLNQSILFSSYRAEIKGLTINDRYKERIS